MAEEKVKKQVEFYFSDSNFRKDSFLKTAADSDPEGFVPISVLLTFNKLKSLTTDETVVANALKSSFEVVLSDDSKSIRRAKPLPEQDSSKTKTLYVKGYPIDDPDVTIESVSEQFSAFGKVNLVRFRKDHSTKKLKGSVFIEFDEEDSVSKACKAAYDEGSSTVKLSYKETPFLCVLSLTEWLERKAAKHALRSAAKGKPSEKVAVGSKRKLDDKDAPEVDERSSPELTPGLVLKISGLPDTAHFQQIKDSFKAIGDVQYVEHNVGDKHAYMRVADAETAKKMAKVAKEGFKLADGDSDLIVEIISGEEEKNYWANFQKSVRSKDGKQAGRGRGRGRKSFGNKRGRR